MTKFFHVVIIAYISRLITDKKVDKVNHKLRILCFILIKTYFLPDKEGGLDPDI